MKPPPIKFIAWKDSLPRQLAVTFDPGPSFQGGQGHFLKISQIFELGDLDLYVSIKIHAKFTYLYLFEILLEIFSTTFPSLNFQELSMLSKYMKMNYINYQFNQFHEKMEKKT